MLNTFKNWVGQFFQPGAFAREMVSGAFVHGGIAEIVKEKVKKASESHRDEVLTFIDLDVRRRDPIAADNLRNELRLRESCSSGFGPGDENDMMTALTAIHMNPNINYRRTIERFIALGRMTSDELKVELAAMKHDPFVQLLKKADLVAANTITAASDKALNIVSNTTIAVRTAVRDAATRQGYQV